MTCKNCCHYEVCKYFNIYIPEELEDIENYCEGFKNKADYDEAVNKLNKAIEFIKYLDKNYSSYMTEDEKFEEWRK